MKKLITALFFLLVISSSAFAKSWKILPKESEITFTAIQNDAPVTGKFTNISGKIEFDPQNLNKSLVDVEIDLNSLTASYEEMVQSLKSEDWFGVKIFPKAKFVSQKFSKIDDKNFQVTGFLTIRDKKQLIILKFTLEEYLPNQAKVKGYTAINRNDFGVGRGQWTKTDAVKNEVKIEFTVKATSN